MHTLRDLAVSESGFLFDPFTGLTFSVNMTGKFILERLRAGADTSAIIDAVRSQFDGCENSDLVRDIQEFLLLLKEYGLLNPADEA